MGDSGINRLCKEIQDLRTDLAEVFDLLIKQEERHDPPQDVLPFVKAWLKNDRYNIKLHNTSHSIVLTEEGEINHIKAVRQYINRTGIIPYDIQIDSVLIKSVRGIYYDSKTDMINIELNYC